MDWLFIYSFLFKLISVAELLVFMERRKPEHQREAVRDRTRANNKLNSLHSVKSRNRTEKKSPQFNLFLIWKSFT